MAVSQPVSPNDAASRLELGCSPTSTLNEKAPQPVSRADTVLSRTQSTIAAFGTRTVSFASAVGKSLKPNTSCARAACKTRKLEDYPHGYPRLSYFMNSDEAFGMYRRFGQLHSRVLLHKQDQIRRLEDDLKDLDMEDDETQETQAYLLCQEDDQDRDDERAGKRDAIIEKIEKKLLEYGEVLRQTQEMHEMNKPSDRDHKSVSNYFWNAQPLQEADAEFLLLKDDLISVKPGREHAWLDDAVDSLLRWYPCKPVKWLFCDKETLEKTTNQAIHYFSRSRINAFVTFIITFLILALLVVPVWLLYYFTAMVESSDSGPISIGILIVATLIFSAVLSLFTKAKRHEVLAAAAG